MNNKINLIIASTLIILATIIIPLAIAPEGDEPTLPTEIDWRDPASYENKDWSTFSNWNDVNWEVAFTKIDNTQLSTILSSNPNVMDNLDFLREFETKIIGFNKNDFEQLGAENINLFFNAKLSEGWARLDLQDNSIKSYNGEVIILEHGTVDPIELKRLEDETGETLNWKIIGGALERDKGMFAGTYFGNINTNDGLITTDASYIHPNGKIYECRGIGCTLEIWDNGMVNIKGNGIIRDNQENSVEVSNLEFVRFDENGLIRAITIYDHTSTINGAELSSDKEILYDMEHKIISGERIIVKSTPREIIYSGTEITFQENEENVATLGFGSTRYVTNRDQCLSDVSCIAYDSHTGEVNVRLRGSLVDVESREGLKLNVDKISDESRAILTREETNENGDPKKVLLLGIDKNGIHPRKDLIEEIQKGNLEEIKYSNGRLPSDSSYKAHQCVSNECSDCRGTQCNQVNFNCIK
jgi:hypothetical protein